MFTGFFLLEACRLELIKLIPFLFEKEVAEHITLIYSKHSNEFYGAKCEIYAVVNTPHMQYVLCSVNGSKLRADGVPYHITWSIDSTCKPKDTGLHAKANFDVIQQKLFGKVFEDDIQVLPMQYGLAGSAKFNEQPKKKEQMKQKPEYTVINTMTLSALIANVNEKLQDGWEIVGPAVYVEQKAFFMQTLQKK